MNSLNYELFQPAFSFCLLLQRLRWAAIQLEQAQSIPDKTNRESVKSQQLINQSDSASATLKSSIEQRSGLKFVI
ncbi:hypothetical protein P4S72_22100 [Vibrio sp. PP-XX7]